MREGLRQAFLYKQTDRCSLPFWKMLDLQACSHGGDDLGCVLWKSDHKRLVPY